MMSSLSHQLTSEANVNKAKLDACLGHDFHPVTPGLHGTLWVCSRCKGTVDGLSARWYSIGLAHAVLTMGSSNAPA